MRCFEFGATVVLLPSYLGDGVYASYDGWHIILDLRAQDSCTRIALEPSVMTSLEGFRDRCYEEKAQQCGKEPSHEEAKPVPENLG